jgi:hypothetical protein
MTSKRCKDLLGLYFTDPDCKLDEYVHAFSFERTTLENMIENNVPEKERNYYSIKHIKLFQCYDSTRDVDKKSLLLYCGHLHYERVDCLIYGYNKPEKIVYNGNMYDIFNQVLVATSIINEDMKLNGISENPLDIDTFYEESILNA